MSFDSALQFVLGFEGGFSDHPRDPGGRTNLGITQRTLDAARKAHPGWNLPADVAALRKPQAASIYREEYWDAVKGDFLPPGVALIVFDAAVNQGPARAKRWLQEAAGVVVDGVIGPKTLEAVDEASSLALIREIGALRALGYDKTGNMATFGKGWMRRLMAAVIEATRA